MTKIITDPNKIKEILTLGVEEVIVKKDLEKKLLSGKKLRIKHGVDPTSSDLHLGYAVVYHKLRELQELGHQIVFLIGGFTGRFGDPTDKDKTRELRTRDEVLALAQNYLQQLAKILDIDKVEVRDNSEWYDSWSFERGLKLLSKSTAARMLERDMFQKRMAAGKEIYLHELTYPLLQGWDSVELKSDLTVIGTDQKFNELQARPLQESVGQDPQDIITVPLLVGTDGKMKMSQSLGNYIGITESPTEQFGKIMSIPDDLLLPYFELVARYNSQELARIKQELDQGRNPKELKIELAKAVVSMYHSQAAADRAAAEFDRVFSQKQKPTDIPEVELIPASYDLPELLLKLNLVESKSQARRLIEQGGVKINDKKVNNWQSQVPISSGDIIQVGKRKFVKVK